MASHAGQPSLVPILPPAPHEPVAQAVVLRLSESSLDALRELVRSGLLDKPGSPSIQLELNAAGPSVRCLAHCSTDESASRPPLSLSRAVELEGRRPKTAELAWTEPFDLCLSFPGSAYPQRTCALPALVNDLHAAARAPLPAGARRFGSPPSRRARPDAVRRPADRRLAVGQGAPARGQGEGGA
jgi:hypothetical protein